MALQLLSYYLLRPCDWSSYHAFDQTDLKFYRLFCPDLKVQCSNFGTLNVIFCGVLCPFFDYGKSRKEKPQKLTQLSSRSHPRHLVGKRTGQKRHHHRHHKRQPGEHQFPKQVVTG